MTATGQAPARHAEATEGSTTTGQLRMIWAELGLECQLECLHCYAGAGPRKGFGTMSPDDWETVIRDAAGLGARHVTFIGGEPTLSPALPRLVHLATGLDLTVEIYTNMVRVTPALWDLFTLDGVSLAASWYTSDRAQHAAITGGHDTWRQTRANIAEAARRGIPIRGGIVDGIVPGQRADDAERELRALGVDSTGTDHLREFGRGTIPDPSQACGSCGHRKAAVLPDGSVTPCPLTRWMNAGNVTTSPLADILATVTQMAATLPARTPKCEPETCFPDWKPCRPDATHGPESTADQPRSAHHACNPDCDPNCRPGLGCGPLCTPSACRPII
jgi:MoaA/NifB/PqqE/SkfB family radical SAM enzyme